MDGIAAQLAHEFPVSSTGWLATGRPFQEFYANRNNAKTMLLAITAAVGFLLLIACANIMNLLLARYGAKPGDEPASGDRSVPVSDHSAVAH